MTPLLTLALHSEHDVVVARQRARQIAALLGFEAQDQTRIATAVSEIARNAFRYAGGGRVEYRIEGSYPRQALAVRVHDRGPGIADLSAVLEGRYTSRTGMGVGLVGARRLMDGFQIDTAAGRGTTVVLSKRLPRGAPAVDAPRLADIARELARHRPRDAMEEVQQQNQELLLALDELRARQEEMERLNRELEDTNRGVVALYAELDERAEQLKRANQLKAQFLSYMSHEFRTPLDSILALSGLLLDRMDGDLTPEQERQVGFVRRSARDLLNMVDDLLDLSRVEAGQIGLRLADFTVADVFNALRAMIRPLLTNDAVHLVFGDAAALPPLHSDEAKVSQILRNFVSNALKFTEQGEVRISAELEADGETLRFCVADTGIGIAPADQERIFQDYAQVEGPVQRRVRGAGLGLPLSRKLAELLGGSITLQSVPGEGSVFCLRLPRRHPAPPTGAAPGAEAEAEAEAE